MSNLLFFAASALFAELDAFSVGVLVSLDVALVALLVLNYRGHTTTAASLFIVALLLTAIVTTISDSNYYSRVAHLYVIAIMFALIMLGWRSAVVVGMVALVASSVLLTISEPQLYRRLTPTTWWSSVLDSGFVLYILLAARHVALHEHQAREAALKALHVAEQRYQMLFEHATFALVQLAPDGTILAANQTWRSFYGAQVGQIVGTAAQAYHTADEMVELNAYIKDVLASHKPMQQTLSLNAPTGGKVWVEVTTMLRDDNVIWISLRDISQQKLREQILHQKARLVEMVSNAIIETDANFQITTWNPAAARIYGFTTAEAIGQRVSHIVKADAVLATEALNHLLAHGEWSGELLQHRKDGTPIIVLSSVRVLRDDNGTVTGFLGVGADISSTRELADERYRKRQLQQVVATHSRSLRDPLAAMLLDVHLLQNNPDDSVRRISLESLQHHVDGFERQIRSLLLMTHLDDDETPYPMPIESVDVADLLRVVHQRHKIFAQQQRQTFELVDLPPSLQIQGGRLELERVFDDLVSYGLRRTSIGGALRIHARATATQTQIRMLCDREQGADAGTGRRPATDNGEAHDEATGHHRELDTVRKLVRLNGGNLAIDITAHQLTFILTLPLRLR